MESPFLLVSPAFAGAAAALVLMGPALDAARKRGPKGQARARALGTLPLATAALAALAALGATLLQVDAGSGAALLGVGIAGALVAVYQGFTARRGLPKLEEGDEAGYRDLLRRGLVALLPVLALGLLVLLMTPP